jgi:8-oxo-dGTP diphosphatase
MAKITLERPVLAVDVVVFSLEGAELVVLLSRREKKPFEGTWALPGVALRLDETLEEAACRALRDKSGLGRVAREAIHLEQLAAFDALYRDPRGRTVGLAQLGLVRGSPAPGKGSQWRAVSALHGGNLPFDHGRVLESALVRLRGKIRYTNLAARLLPETFRIEDLEEVYEAILARPINRANFRTKLLRIGLIERAGIAEEAVGSKGGRPPHLYRFAKGQIEAEDRDFL